MSDFSTYCDALINDLTTNVSGLAGVTTHSPAPWSPAELLDDGERHLAVWPNPQAERVAPGSTGHHELHQQYVILYWEPAPAISDRGVDDDGAAAMLDLHNAVRARLYVTANQTLGGTIRAWYDGTDLPERSSQTRHFLIYQSVMTGIPFT